MTKWPDQKKIESHLRKQYKNIFSEQALQSHLKEYIGEDHTHYLIEKIIPFVSKSSRILDIGSGYGEFVRKANILGFDAHGIEIAKFEHSVSQKMAKNLNISQKKFVLGSAFNLPYSNESFDAITFWNVLEHLDDFKIALNEAIRVLKPSGKIFILAPNYCSFRREAHYHVPWIPFFPKKLAAIYLKMLGKDPKFLLQNIFYVSTRQVIKHLKKNNLHVTTELNKKIEMNLPINSSSKRLVMNIVKRLKLTRLFNFLIFSLKTNTFTKAIDIIAEK